MGRAFRIGLFCSVAGCWVPGYASAAGNQTPRVRIVLHNSTSTDAAVVFEARTLAIEVFGKAGVDLHFAQEGAAGCRASAPELFCVQVLLRPRNRQFAPGQRRTMGMALAADADRAVVSVYLDAVTDVARRYGLPLGKVLGIAVAHELGHVLLPPPSHSHDGIMQAAWEGDDLRKAAGHAIAFNDAQAAMMRDRLMNRDER